MDQNKLNRLLYYLEYRIYTGYEAARPTRKEEKEWAEMLTEHFISYGYRGLIEIAISDLHYFIRFIKYDNTRNKCISCEFEEFIAEILKIAIKKEELDSYNKFLENLKK